MGVIFGPVPPSSITSEQEERVVSLYRQGSKLADICADVGLNRSSVYWVLQKRGVEPNRQSRPRRDEGTDDSMAPQLLLDVTRALVAIHTQLVENTKVLHEVSHELRQVLKAIADETNSAPKP